LSLKPVISKLSTTPLFRDVLFSLHCRSIILCKSFLPTRHWIILSFHFIFFFFSLFSSFSLNLA
jgi:hypothetical protein